jgi:cytoskeletal protein CcmA (bactofilin family)
MSAAIIGESTSTKRTVVEEGTALRGTLSSSCPIVILGKVHGELSAPSILVAESGVVSGSLKAKELCSRGELAGTIDAEVLQLSGRVRDRTVIRAQRLEVKLGGANGEREVVLGSCELEVGEAPDKEAAIRAARSTPAAAASPERVAPEAPPAAEAVPEPLPAESSAARSSRRAVAEARGHAAGAP